MASYYQGSCSKCSYDAGMLDSDLRVLRLDSGEFIPIGPHSAEQDLKRAGYTWAEATRQKRLAVIQHFVCNDCGEIAEKYSIDVEGWLVFVLPGAIPLIAIAFSSKFWPDSFFPALGIGYLVMYLWIKTVEGLLRWRGRKQAKLLPPFVDCRKCAGKRFTRITWFFFRRYMCPQCRRRTLQYMPIEVYFGPQDPPA